MAQTDKLNLELFGRNGMRNDWNDGAIIDANMQKVDAANAGSSLLQSATVTLTASQLKALHATPVTLVAAPGANKAYSIQGVTCQYNHVTTDYTTPSDSRFEFGPAAAVAQDYVAWESELHPPWLRDKVDGIDYAVVQFSLNATGDGQVNIIPKSLMANQPLVAGNPGSDFADGDGTVTVTVYYTVVDLS